MKPIRVDRFSTYQVANDSIKRYRPTFWKDLSTATRHVYYAGSIKQWIVVEGKAGAFEVSYYMGCPSCNS